MNFDFVTSVNAIPGVRLIKTHHGKLAYWQCAVEVPVPGSDGLLVDVCSMPVETEEQVRDLLRAARLNP